MRKNVQSSFFAGILILLLGISFLLTNNTYAQRASEVVVPNPCPAGGCTNIPQLPTGASQDPTDVINRQAGLPQESAPVTAGEFNRRPSQKFMPLAGVPGITNLGTITMPQFLNALYRMLIVIGALIAVLKITVAGLKYMGSDSFGSKASAKEDITAALLGLLILLATVLIINTVLGSVNLNALQGPSINFVSQPPTTIAPQTTQPGTIALNPASGCAQVAAGSCGTDNVAIFKGSSVGCASSNAVPAPSGQSTFKYMTEAQCKSSMNVALQNGINRLVEQGKGIYGILEVGLFDTPPTDAALLAACQAAGGSQVVKHSMGQLSGTDGYVCTN